jgi:hypothetical protein
MANQQVIVSVLGDTRNFSRSMKSSSKIMAAFGAAVVAGAVVAGRALADFVGDSIKAAEDAAAVSRRFDYLTKQSGLFGDETEKVTEKIKAFARAQSFATGVDDEAIVAAATKVLAFRKVASSADELNGVYDRTIAVSLDVASVLGGTGDGLANIESVAPRVAKALENPIKYLGSLARIGVVFTDQEKAKIAEIQKSNGLFAAQDYLLKELEKRYEGAGESGAKASEKIQARFEDLQEQVGDKLLPSIEDIADEFGAWLDGPAGQQAIDDFVGSFEKLVKYLADPKNVKRLEAMASGVGKIASAMSEVFIILDKIAAFPDWFLRFWMGDDFRDRAQDAFDAFSNYENGNNAPTGGGGGNSNPGNGPFGGTSQFDRSRGIVVNFNAPVDSVSAGREVARVLSDFQRANGRR